jgi:GH24 family phage-related lysozyme (muramidase)
MNGCDDVAMEMMMQEVAKKHIKFSEDYRDTIYLDSKKYPTFGWGHCYTTEHPFNTVREYADWLFEMDFQRAYIDYLRIIKEFSLENLSCPRRMVLLDMCYNMNYSKVKRFVNTLGFMRNEQFEAAAEALKQSAWYTQTGTRAKRLVNVVLTGSYPSIPDRTASGVQL